MVSLEPFVVLTITSYLSENYPTALAIIPNKREKKLKKILDNYKVELWR